MPIYEYSCMQCGNVTEALQKFSDQPLTTCEHCSGKLQKLISQSCFHLKGSGWYVTDYANKSGKPDQSAGTKPDTNSDNKLAKAPEPKKKPHPQRVSQTHKNSLNRY